MIFTIGLVKINSAPVLANIHVLMINQNYIK